MNPDHYRFRRTLHRPEAIEIYTGGHRRIDTVIVWLACLGIAVLLLI